MGDTIARYRCRSIINGERCSNNAPWPSVYCLKHQEKERGESDPQEPEK